MSSQRAPLATQLERAKRRLDEVKAGVNPGPVEFVLVGVPEDQARAAFVALGGFVVEGPGYASSYRVKINGRTEHYMSVGEGLRLLITALGEA